MTISINKKERVYKRFDRFCRRCGCRYTPVSKYNYYCHICYRNIKQIAKEKNANKKKQV